MSPSVTPHKPRTSGVELSPDSDRRGPPRPQLSVQDVEEKLHADTVARFVGECLNKYVDARSTEQRHLMGELHRNMLESGHLTAEAYLSGAKELLEVASDLACDIPSLWANLGELLAPPLTAGRGVTLQTLAAPAAGIVADNYGGKFVTGVLKRLKSLHGADKVRGLVPANFDWKLYFGSDDHVQPLINVSRPAALGQTVTDTDTEIQIQIYSNKVHDDCGCWGVLTDVWGRRARLAHTFCLILLVE